MQLAQLAVLTVPLRIGSASRVADGTKRWVRAVAARASFLPCLLELRVALPAAMSSQLRSALNWQIRYSVLLSTTADLSATMNGITDEDHNPRSDAPPPPSPTSYAFHRSEDPMNHLEDYQTYTIAGVASERAQQPFKVQVPQTPAPGRYQQPQSATVAASSPLLHQGLPGAASTEAGPQGETGNNYNSMLGWTSSGTWQGDEEAVSFALDHGKQPRGTSPTGCPPQQAQGAPAAFLKRQRFDYRRSRSRVQCARVVSGTDTQQPAARPSRYTNRARTNRRPDSPRQADFASAIACAAGTDRQASARGRSRRR